MSYLYRLVMYSEPDRSKEFILNKDEVFIGRELINDVVISDPEVSRRHAKLMKRNDDYFLEDIGSTNGTYVKGQRVKKQIKLKNEDLINLSKNVVLKFLKEEVEKESSGKKPKQAAKEPIEKKNKKEEESTSSKKATLKEFNQKGFSEKKQAHFNVAGFKSMPTWVLVLILALIFLILFCIIPFLIVDMTNQWCNLFHNFFNAIRPGVCP